MLGGLGVREAHVRGAKVRWRRIGFDAHAGCSEALRDPDNGVCSFNAELVW